MIISEQHRYVFVGIPKAASRAVASWLVSHYAGSAVGYHHSWAVPREYEEFLVFTVVRNPYARCFSAWWFRCREPSRKFENPMFGWSFSRFMRSVLDFRARTGHHQQLPSDVSIFTQAEFVDLSHAALALQLESNQLHLLPFVREPVPPLLRINETATRPPIPFHDYFSSEEEQLVWDYCSDDFHRFGYVRRPFS